MYTAVAAVTFSVFIKMFDMMHEVYATKPNSTSSGKMSKSDVFVSAQEEKTKLQQTGHRDPE